MLITRVKPPSNWGRCSVYGSVRGAGTCHARSNDSIIISHLGFARCDARVSIPFSYVDCAWKGTKLPGGFPSSGWE